MKKIKVCPICGTEMKIDTSAVCTSIPPMYRCVCPSCNCLDFIKTSEYDQYKEEPSLPEGLEEAAENYIAPIENDEGLDYINFNGRDIKDAFIAGAEWMKAKMMEEAVECMVVDFSSNLPRPQVDIRLDPGKYHTGDKVKVIVIKED